MSKDEKTVSSEEIQACIDELQAKADGMLEIQAGNLVNSGLPILASALIDGDAVVLVSPRLYDKIKKIRGE